MMKSFLELVAADLFRQTQGDLAHTAVVFPNKRAGLFFNEHLARAAGGRPLWSPAYISISELFHSLSTRQVGDTVKLICELYKVFQRETKSPEALDDFYFWGEMLLADFDDADKNLANTDSLFANLRDLRHLADDHSFLTEEQEEAIRQFFLNFSIERQTVLKERFTAIWDVLGPVYKGFREVLAQQNIAYEGMLCREVIENLDTDHLPYQRYVFVGHNVLNKVEHTLFSRLQEEGKALFYWDYDSFYLNVPHHEAGEFIRRNLHDFPSPLPPSCFDTLSKPKEVHYVEASTENAQARYLPQWLRAHLTPNEKETAVVLCNEALLQPVLHSLPNEVRHANITMGFPLSQTPVFSFVTALLELYVHGYNPKTGRYAFQQVVALLKHPYTRLLTESARKLEKDLIKDNRFFPLPSELTTDAELTLLFTPAESNLKLCTRLAEVLQRLAICLRGDASADNDNAFNQLYVESLFKAYTTVNRFRTLTEAGDLSVQADTLRRLLTKVLSATTIPFHGEPAEGLQVMGLLETRCLDFKHLALLSVNEGLLPKAGGDASFIPYNLRKAFGMTTTDHRTAVYAYYFYRLLQRAEKVTLMYSTGTEGLHRGEWSRFLLQFLIEWPHPIVRERLQAGQSPQRTEPIEVKKTPEVMKRLQDAFDIRVRKNAKLSPTALNTYLDCQLKFFYKYVAGLKAPEEVTAEIDPAMFGTIFHSVAEHIYKDLTAHGKLITKEVLEKLLRNEVKIESYVDQAFKKEFFHVSPGDRAEYNGTQLIISEVIVRYIMQLLRRDLDYAPFTFVASELEVQAPVTIPTPNGEIKSRVGGIVDRMDVKDGVLRVVDYKTGGDAGAPNNVESLFTPGPKRSGYVFQAFLYSAIVCQKVKQKVAPSLLYIHRASAETYSPVIQMGEARRKEPVDDFAKFELEFRQRLGTLLEEIFNPNLTFCQTETKEKCVYCDYKGLCRR